MAEHLDDEPTECSFCAKPLREVRQLIAAESSRDVAICNECIFLAVGYLVLDTEKVKPATLPVPVPTRRRQFGRCASCGVEFFLVDGLPKHGEPYCDDTSRVVVGPDRPPPGVDLDFKYREIPAGAEIVDERGEVVGETTAPTPMLTATLQQRLDDTFAEDEPLSCTNCNRPGGERRRGRDLEATGRTRQLTMRQRSNGHSRTLSYRIEYRCTECGHTGWSRHIDAGRLLRRLWDEQASSLPTDKRRGVNPG